MASFSLGPVVHPWYNNGSPVLRIIEFEDTYLYHIVRTFQLDINIDKLFHSINLDPWNGNKYDVYYYNSYNCINIYLKKYNQRLILMKNSKILILHINTFVENVIKNLIIQNAILVLTQVIWKLIQKKMKKMIKFGGVGNVEKMLHFIM